MKFRTASISVGALLGFSSLFLTAAGLSAQPQQSAEAAVVTAPNISELAQAGVPRLIQFSGTLKDSASRPVAGVASVTFAIYNEQNNGTALWSETQNVLADASGHYSVLLGAATANGVPADLFGTGESRWLGIAIVRQPEAPRVLLASVPYALKAGDSDTLGGLPASSYVTTQQLAARSTTPVVSGGGSTIIATPGVASANAAEATTTGTQSVIQANPTGSGATDYIPLWTSGSNLGDSLLFQTGGKVGIGTTTPAATLDINGGEILRGGYYEYPEDTATASNGGKQSHSFQWLSSVFNSSSGTAVNPAFGFRAIPLNNDTSNPSAKLDLFYGLGGPTGTINDLGLSINSTGVITFVPGQTFNGVSETLTGNLNLPTTTGPNSGVITLGGYPFINDMAGNENLFIGVDAGGAFQSNGNSSYNTAVGSLALYSNTSGVNNVAIGGEALRANTSGRFNVAVGTGAAAGITTGQLNTSMGEESFQANTTGSSNVAIGFFTGAMNTTGSNNTFLGANANAGAEDLTYATAIGSAAIVGESNAIVLGPAGSGAPAVGIGTAAPTHTLDVVDRGTGSAAIYASSTVVADTAVYGISTAASGVGSNGGFFSSASPLGSGVVGSNLSGGYGGYFQGNNYAGYFAGNVGVSGNLGISGTLTKGGGSFKIDDPIDPANKYLSHSFVESPDMMNIYNGIVTLDAHGTATVEMPEWFQALNRDFRYTLTAIGSPAPKIYIAEQISGNQFKIAGGKKGQKISWMVTGIRHDAWANAHRIPNEEEKPANEQGKYLHPELFGAGPDKAVDSRGAINAQSPVPAPPDSQSTPPSPSTAIPGGR
jgi:hypothetical protein